MVEVWGFLPRKTGLTGVECPSNVELCCLSVISWLISLELADKGFGDNSSLKELWNSIKSNPDEFDKYQNMANDSNIKKGLPTSKNPLSANSKLIIRKILNFSKCRKQSLNTNSF